MMPLVERKFDERLAKFKADQDAAKAEAEKTELQKATDRATKAEAMLAETTRVATVDKRAAELVGKTGGAVPYLMARAIAGEWDGDWDVVKAVERANAELEPALKARGGTAQPIATFPGAGGSPATGDDGLTDADLANQLAAGKLKLSEFNEIMDRRRYARAGQAHK